MSNDIVVQNWQPVATVDEARGRYQAMRDFVEAIMREAVDFGVIPGTDRNTLLKPGAEKLATFFGLATDFETVTAVEDWTGQDHGGEPFFYYRVKCNLTRSGHLVANAEGSANSWEKKYRYRQAERVCPSCGNPAIIKGREEYGGGWLCFLKKGGCGKKYADADPAITEQSVGQVKNPDIADQVNTILKMSQKRALVAAVLIAVNGSDYFTQDMEDLDFGVVVDVTPRPVTESKPRPTVTHETVTREQANGTNGKKAERPFDAETARAMLLKKAELLDGRGEAPSEGQAKMIAPNLEGLFPSDPLATDKRRAITEYVFGKSSTKDLTGGEALALVRWCNHQKDEDTGEWIPDFMAIHEGEVIYREHMKASGQAELFEEPA